jgi:uncharacterized protein (DUF305 family)
VTSQRTRTTIAFAILALASVAPVARAQATAATTVARRDYTQADVQFMQGMIGHHAQAIVMAAMAPTHGASAQIALFARKISASQRDEIEQMQTWLADRGEKVPDPNDPHAMMHMDAQHADMKVMKDMKHDAHMDMDHEMLMPGMLTADQLAALDRARGVEFDRLFLTLMIQHHEGALTMVQTLFDTPRAGQGAEIFGYATGVDADQRAEIERMERMLASLGR